MATNTQKTLNTEGLHNGHFATPKIWHATPEHHDRRPRNIMIMSMNMLTTSHAHAR